MELNETFKYYGTIDVSNILKTLENEELSWDEFTFRQESFMEHRTTKTIPILFDFNFNTFNPSPTKHYEKFKDIIVEIESYLKPKIKTDGYIMRALLVKLLKKTSIPPHIDVVGESLRIARRIHIPIITNESCLFSVGDDVKHLKVGEVWEINNDKKSHGVSNNGNEDRIHLIVDWVDDSTLKKI